MNHKKKPFAQDDMISKISQGIEEHINEVMDYDLLFSNEEYHEELVVEEKKALPVHLLISIGLLVVIVLLLVVWLIICG